MATGRSERGISMKTGHGLWAGLLLAGIAAPTAAEDAEGCKDHPLFNRLPNYQLASCESVEFDATQFPAGPALDNPATGEKTPQPVTVEGSRTILEYGLKEGATPASALQVQRNFETAIKAAGGAAQGSYDRSRNENSELFEGWDRNTVYKLTKGNREVWVQVMSADYPGYKLRIAERDAMKQEIVANELIDRINKDGFVALYINFDTGKATIKPDSNKTLDEVAAALKSAPALKLEVGGHTDNVGTADANRKLSEDRAKSVVAALAARGVAAARLTAKGYGQDKPVADNRTEDGRAKNRRVELVKR